MPEREFELYLSLLGRLLRLAPSQRAEIADEFRDHLESRLEELMREGLSRDDAVRRALEEFGDAAALATHFTHLAHLRTRRRIMRWTTGTICAAAAAILAAIAFWPANPALNVPDRAVAQGDAVYESAPPGAADPAAAAPGGKSKSASETDKLRATVEAKLDERLPSVDFVDMPFADSIGYLSDLIGVDILINRRFAESAGVAHDTPINLSIQTTPVSARTVLELVLEQVSGETASSELGYTIRDGLIYVTSKFETNRIEVYNVRDLVVASQTAHAGAEGATAPMMPGGFGAAGMQGAEMGGLGGGGGLGFTTPGQQLVQVVTTTIHPDTWTASGGSGSIEEFNGLLIVKHSDAVHRELGQLLEMMRSANGNDPGGPAGGGMGSMGGGGMGGMGGFGGGGLFGGSR